MTSIIVTTILQLVNLNIEDIICPILIIKEFTGLMVGFLVHFEPKYNRKSLGQAGAHLLNDRVGACSFVFVIGKALNTMIIKAEIEELLDIVIVGPSWHNTCTAVASRWALRPDRWFSSGGRRLE
jgi:hypothetical protein